MRGGSGGPLVRATTPNSKPRPTPFLARRVEEIFQVMEYVTPALNLSDPRPLPADTILQVRVGGHGFTISSWRSRAALGASPFLAANALSLTLRAITQSHSQTRASCTESTGYPLRKRPRWRSWTRGGPGPPALLGRSSTGGPPTRRTSWSTRYRG